MRSSSWFGQALVALVLAAAGAILWRTSESEHRLAAAERDLVTLRYEEAAAQAQAPGRIASLLPGNNRLAADAKALSATAAYWQGDYDTVDQVVELNEVAARLAAWPAETAARALRVLAFSLENDAGLTAPLSWPAAARRFAD